MRTDTVDHPVITNAEYPVHDIIQQRWSPRSFSDDPIEPDLLRQLFEAVRWAPSSYNEQPWRFFVATKDDKEAYDKLLDTLSSGNQRWAQDAPVLILTVVKTTFSRSGAENRAALHDLGQAVAHLSFEATRNNLYLHQMAGIDLQKAREVFNIPEGFKPFTGIALGHIGEAEPPTSRSRKELEEIVFRGDWKSGKSI